MSFHLSSSQSPPLYAAPHGCEPLRATLPDLSSPQGRPRLAGVANYTPLARQRIASVSAPTNQSVASYSLPLSPRVSEARHLWSQLLPQKSVFIRFLRYRPDMPLTALSRIESLAQYSVQCGLGCKKPSLNKCATPALTNDGWEELIRPSSSAVPL